MSGLHSSLVELGQMAQRCDSVAAARGIAAEAQELARNAVRHRTEEVRLALWFSRLITDLAASPALSPLTRDIRFTGAIARGDGLPSLPIMWFGSAPDFAQLLTHVGLKVAPAPNTPVFLVDASLPLPADPHPTSTESLDNTLLQCALASRPPTLHLVDGLPDREAEVNVEQNLLDPVAAIARWVAPAPRPTLDRLAIGRERELLTSGELEALTLAWQTGLALELRHWVDHVGAQPVSLSHLPPLDRTAYGSACRSVSETLAGIAARKGKR